MRRVFIFPFLLILFSFVACSTSSLEDPEVRLTDVQFEKMTLFETGVRAQLRFMNPNDVRLKVKSGKHRLKLNSLDVGKAYHEGSFTLEPYETSVQTVTFRFSNLTLVTKMQSLLNAGHLNYEVDSIVRTDRGSFDIKESGTVAGP